MTWQTVKLGDILERKKNLIKIEDDKEYKLVTVRLFHKGVNLRKVAKGSELCSSKMHSVKTGEFILSGIDARHGAFGIIPAELEGAVVSNDFWCLSFDKEIIEKQFFLKLTSTTFFDDLCKKASDGTTNRVRLQADKFFNLEITLPPIEEQKDFVQRYSKIEETKFSISTELNHQLALVKELRQAYLREAMQGKLVPQDERDEPAEILLEKIKAEKYNRLLACSGEASDRRKNDRLTARRTKDKSLPPINAEEIPFEIPSNWTWCRLIEIANSMSTGPFGTMLHQSDYVKVGIPLVNPMNIVNGKIVPSGKMMVNEETKKRLSSYELEKGDVVVARRGEMGRCAVVTENESGWLCGTGSFFISLSSFIDRDFFVKVFSSDYSKSYLSSFSVGSTMDNLNHRILNSYPFPLPPLAEQERIVAKLEKLMKFSGDLEVSIRQGIKNADQLLQTALKEALEPK